MPEVSLVDALVASMIRAQGIDCSQPVGEHTFESSPAREAATMRAVAALRRAFALAVGDALGKKWRMHFASWLCAARASENSLEIVPSPSALANERELLSKLTKAGASASERRQASSRLARAANEARAAIALATNARRERVFVRRVEVARARTKVVLTCGGVEVEVNERHFERLREMFEKRSGRDLSGDAFVNAAYCVLARYSSMQGGHHKAGNMQASAPPRAFDAMRVKFGVDFELFASPMNAYLGRFCSANVDTDRAFGSEGSAFDFMPSEGSYEANPPFDEGVMAAMAAHLERTLASSAKPLSFCVIVPRWIDSPAWLRLAKSVYCTSNTTLEAKEHAFVSGGAHTRKDQLTASAAATSFLTLQNKAGSKKWPASDEAIAAIRAGFALPEKHIDRACDAAAQRGKRPHETLKAPIAAAKKAAKTESGKYSAGFFRDE